MRGVVLYRKIWVEICHNSGEITPNMTRETKKSTQKALINGAECMNGVEMCVKLHRVAGNLRLRTPISSQSRANLTPFLSPPKSRRDLIWPHSNSRYYVITTVALYLPHSVVMVTTPPRLNLRQNTFTRRFSNKTRRFSPEYFRRNCVNW